jgi:hypothetical protein
LEDLPGQAGREKIFKREGHEEAQRKTLKISSFVLLCVLSVKKFLAICPSISLFRYYKKTLRVVIVPPIEQARGLFKGIDSKGLREEEDDERG